MQLSSSLGTDWGTFRCELGVREFLERVGGGRERRKSGSARRRRERRQLGRCRGRWRCAANCRSRAKQRGEEDGQVLEQALNDEADLDVTLVGREFAAGPARDTGRLTVEVLIAVATAIGINVANQK